MKKQSLFYNIICVLALTACSSSTRYVISGTVPEDLNGKYIYMLRNGNFRYGERNTNLDSAWVENGKFRFIGNVEGNAVRFISTSQQAFTFILEPGEIMFDITDEMSLKGTPLNDELTQYRKALKGVEEKYREINEAVKADPAFVKTERFRTMNEEARQMKKGICTSVIVKHKDNALGEYVLREWLISCQKLEEFDTAYDLLERRPVDFGPLKGDIMRWEEVRKSMPGLMKCKFKSVNFTQLVGEHNEIRTTIQIEDLVILSLFPIFLYYLQRNIQQSDRRQCSCFLAVDMDPP